MREREPERGAEHREDHAFGGELAEDASPSRAERRSNRELFVASLCAHEQEVRDVRAGDEKNEHHRALENPERFAHVADDFRL